MTASLPLSPWSAASLTLVPLVWLGIRRMRSPATAVGGNTLGAMAMTGFVALAAIEHGLWKSPAAWAWGLGGAVAGGTLAARARMIRMPELVALFNGLGGAASAIVAALALRPGSASSGVLSRAAAPPAAAIGVLTFTGSLVAVLKLARVLDARPIRFRGQVALNRILLAGMIGGTLAGPWMNGTGTPAAAALMLLFGGAAGVTILLGVGGADMPVSISFLNALSGAAAAVAGFAVGHPAPVAVGIVVGAGGLLLTNDMCRAMNRSLGDVLAGRIASAPSPVLPEGAVPAAMPPSPNDPVAALRSARRVIIVPGYGMALAQAQAAVRRLYDALSRRGVEVWFGIHPVAGRMPGHMHVLLAEVEIPYDRFKDLEEINPLFGDCDVAVIVGANDVVNPAARTAAGTPISGMPVLDAGAAKTVVICNLDRQPGYAGVPNPLYDRPHVTLCLGDAAETVVRLAEALERC